MASDNAILAGELRNSATDSLKVPPHSIEAEQSVLGGLMLDNEAWLQVAERITQGDFYRRDHNEIFRAIESLANDGKPYDVVTLAEWLGNNELLAAVGGLEYLAELSENTPSAANIAAYADIVRERSVLRHSYAQARTLRKAVTAPKAARRMNCSTRPSALFSKLPIGKPAASAASVESRICSSMRSIESICYFSAIIPSPALPPDFTKST